MLCLRSCRGFVESLEPWVYRHGPVNVLVDNGVFTLVDSCPSGSEVVDCEGVLAPCPFDSLLAPSFEPGAWLDEVYNKTVSVDARKASDILARGFCGALVYGTIRGGVDAQVKLVEPGVIVYPDGRVEKRGEGPIVAAVAVTRRSVYSWRSRTGRFPVEWLSENNLLGPHTVVVGSWVASWEVNRVREAGGVIAVPVIAQALGRGGPPPRPQYRDVLVIASGGVDVDAWLLAYTALVVCDAVYWGLCDAADILAGLVRGWRIAGIEPKPGAIPYVVLDVHDFRGDPLTLILSKPRVAAVVGEAGELVQLEAG